MCLLDSPVTARSVILVHDTMNAEIRAGLSPVHPPGRWAGPVCGTVKASRGETESRSTAVDSRGSLRRTPSDRVTHSPRAG